MRQIDPSFAERILRKYSSVESYGLDESTLVFYRENVSVGGTNSAYYTELMLKLLVMYQTYEQSGQQLNLNWNLFYQLISKQMSGLSAKVERLMLPVSEQLKIERAIPDDVSAPESKSERTEAVHRAIVELERQLELSVAGSRNLRPMNGIGTARFRLRFFREREERINQGYVDEWFRHLTVDESEQVWKNLLLFSESRVHTSAEHSRSQEQIHQAMEQIAEEEGKERFENGAKTRLIRLLAREPQALSQILRQMLAVQRDSREEKTITTLFRKYEDRIFRRLPYRETEGTRLASRIFTIMESRFTEPALAKEAESEFLDILVRDFYIKEQELIWREEKGEQSVQERENELQAFIRLIEAPKVMAVIRQRIMEADEKRRDKLLQWIRKFEAYTVPNLKRGQERNSQVTQEERHLITQVGMTLGKEDAERLEHYFLVRNQVTDRAAEHEIVKFVNRSLESIANSYLDITKNNDLVNVLGGESPLYLQNLVRERVHEPSTRCFSAYRRTLETSMRQIQRHYAFSQILGNTFLEAREIHPVSWEIRQEERDGLVYPLLLGERNTDVVRRDQWEETRTELLLKQTGQEGEINETKRQVETLREKVEIQEKLVNELKQKAGTTVIPAQVNINQLTRQVIKKMEDDLRLEKMRRGLL